MPSKHPITMPFTARCKTDCYRMCSKSPCRSGTPSRSVTIMAWTPSTLTNTITYKHSTHSIHLLYLKTSYYFTLTDIDHQLDRDNCV